MKNRSGRVIGAIFLGLLCSGCALAQMIFSEKDPNKRAGRIQIQSSEASNDGVQVVLQKGHSDMIHTVVMSRDGRSRAPVVCRMGSLCGKRVNQPEDRAEIASIWPKRGTGPDRDRHFVEIGREELDP